MQRGLTRLTFVRQFGIWHDDVVAVVIVDLEAFSVMALEK